LELHPSSTVEGRDRHRVGKKKGNMMRRSPRHPRRIMSDAAALVLVLLGLTAAAGPAQALRLVAYNCLNYDNLYSTRDPAFRTVISGISNIDVLAVEEIQDQTALNRFLNNVLNQVEPGQWAAAPYYNDAGANFNPGLFYRISTITYVSSDTLGNSPRSIPYYTLRAKPYTSTEAEFTVFVCHLKASSSSSDEQTRLEEATRIRNRMNSFPAGSNMMVVGDLNLYTSTEPAYQKLLEYETNNIGRVQDPINTPGSWHNSATYAAIHTQSTRTGYLDPNDGGATGGLDDRFDFILPTFTLADGQKLDQLPSTYLSYGNDGQHFNLNINDPPTNSAVGQTIADALQRASDHLPVKCDFQVPAIVSADASVSFGTVIVGATAQQNLNVDNVATAPADVLDYSMVAPVGFTAPGGTFYLASGAGTTHTLAMLTTTAGNKSGNLVISSDDVDNPSLNVPLSGIVLRHAVPSLTGGGQTLSGNLDFGTHDEGLFTDQSVSTVNLGYDALQALLNVYDANITGGEGRFSIAGGFSPVDVGGTAASFDVAFDDAGAARESDTTYTATLVFSTRDQQGLAGASDQSDLTVNLSATVTGTGQVGVGDRPLAEVTFLGANHPNPFRAGGTRISFSLAHDTHVRLAVFDVQGRRVRTLADGNLPRGEYDLGWNGRADDGREVTPGVYFYRLETPGYTATRRMTKLR
jgi:endonuclease/exonuclease/phosphatase family metal-dependent hydrolase